MSSHKNGARSGADGNMRLLAQYGGHRSGRRAFADGGAVNPSLDEGLAAAGDSDMKPSKDKGEKKTARTNINIIVNGKDPAPPTGAAGMAPPPPMPMPMPPPMPPAPPMAGPPGPPMGPGGPMMGPGGPLPMRASGGRVDKHADAKADKKMVKAAVGKHEAAKHPGKPMTKLSVGGPAKAPTEKSMLAEKGFQGGGGGAIGRLEKIKKFGK